MRLVILLAGMVISGCYAQPAGIQVQDIFDGQPAWVKPLMQKEYPELVTLRENQERAIALHPELADVLNYLVTMYIARTAFIPLVEKMTKMYELFADITRRPTFNRYKNLFEADRTRVAGLLQSKGLNSIEKSILLYKWRAFNAPTEHQALEYYNALKQLLIHSSDISARIVGLNYNRWDTIIDLKDLSIGLLVLMPGIFSWLRDYFDTVRAVPTLAQIQQGASWQFTLPFLQNFLSMAQRREPEDIKTYRSIINGLTEQHVFTRIKEQHHIDLFELTTWALPQEDIASSYLPKELLHPRPTHSQPLSRRAARRQARAESRASSSGTTQPVVPCYAESGVETNAEQDIKQQETNFDCLAQSINEQLRAMNIPERVRTLRAEYVEIEDDAHERIYRFYNFGSPLIKDLPAQDITYLSRVSDWYTKPLAEGNVDVIRRHQYPKSLMIFFQPYGLREIDENGRITVMHYGDIYTKGKRGTLHCQGSALFPTGIDEENIVYHQWYIPYSIERLMHDTHFVPEVKETLLKSWQEAFPALCES